MTHDQYESLPTATDENRQDSFDSDEPFVASLEKTPRRPLGNLRRRFYWVIAVVLLIFAPAILFAFHRMMYYQSKSRWMHCGSTVKEAHARGCSYDVMIGSWLLPECSDSELMEDYLATRDWEFYRDQNLTEVIPMDVLRLGEHRYPVFATVRQHQFHCAYVWEKQFRAAVSGRKLDDLSASSQHNHHCAQALADGMPGAKGNLGLDIKFFSCVKAGEGDPKRANNPNNRMVPHQHQAHD